eukprot:GHVR01127021.1.p1 GENE.GHVR01127021.1~~GHVR01127021.1.p1  ORF type:complete len:161 (+),score=25.71 GHVR01127021.1:45-527(+)
MKQEERLAYELELKEKEEIRFGFRLLDEDGSGSVSADELQRHLNDQGFNEQQSKAAITRIMEYCDKDGSGTIEEGEFVSLMTEKLSKEDPMSDIMNAYRKYDTEKKGDISLKNMRVIADKLGYTFYNEDRLKTMIELTDEGKKSGKVTQDEFVKLMQEDI